MIPSHYEIRSQEMVIMMRTWVMVLERGFHKMLCACLVFNGCPHGSVFNGSETDWERVLWGKGH